ncbi:MAG: tetratricopeptide repeat protein [Syntrophomonadaceae bacterium]|nr:tetratricopeptide repeat protein [Syntrophomonadaceae bacterium]
MKYCTQCGQALSTGSRFCINCGASVQQPAQTVTFEERDQLNDQTQSSVNEVHSKRSRRIISPKVIIGALLAVVIAMGGFWGWNSYGSTEVRTQKQLNLAIKYISENDYEKAILAFNEVIKIDPKEIKGYQGLARVYTLQGKYDEAKAAYDKGITAVNQDKQQTLQLGLAGMYIDQGQLDNAEKAFEEIKNSSPNCLEAYWGLAMVYQQQGDNNKAEAMLRQALEQNPNDYRGYNTLALFLKQNGKADEAFDNIVKSLSFEISQQEAYLILKDIFQGRYADLQIKASQLTANQPLAAMLKFCGFYLAEDYPQALTIYKDSLQQDQSNLKASIFAAIAIVKTGDLSGANAIIAKLDDKKLSDSLLSDLAEYYLSAGDQEKARTYAIKALQANPANLEAIALLQNLNSVDSSLNRYTAQALLYDWRPVVKIMEELINNQIQIPVNLDTLIRENTSIGTQKVETDLQKAVDTQPEVNTKSNQDQAVITVPSTKQPQSNLTSSTAIITQAQAQDLVIKLPEVQKLMAGGGNYQVGGHYTNKRGDLFYSYRTGYWNLANHFDVAGDYYVMAVTGNIYKAKFDRSGYLKYVNGSWVSTTDPVGSNEG